MKSLERRLDKIEARKVQEEYKPPYVAIVSQDGTVKVSHTNEDNFQLPSKAAFNSWIEDNNLNETDYLSVILVNSQGKQPTVC